MSESLRAMAARLPAMDAHAVGGLLERLASEVPEDQAIVEVGCWLGAATAYLSLGALKSGAKIHVYDRFTASRQEVEKAGARGVKLFRGTDTLAMVRESLEPFGADICWHKGNIKWAEWTENGSIGLYLDDASKQPKLWARSAKTFLERVPVGGHVVLMDYYFYEKAGESYRVQRDYMEARRGCFELIDDRPGGTTAAVFRRRA